jgi:hypothetical protein
MVFTEPLFTVPSGYPQLIAGAAFYVHISASHEKGTWRLYGDGEAKVAKDRR